MLAFSSCVLACSVVITFVFNPVVAKFFYILIIMSITLGAGIAFGTGFLTGRIHLTRRITFEAVFPVFFLSLCQAACAGICAFYRTVSARAFLLCNRFRLEVCFNMLHIKGTADAALLSMSAIYPYIASVKLMTLSHQLIAVRHNSIEAGINILYICITYTAVCLHTPCR